MIYRLYLFELLKWKWWYYEKMWKESYFNNDLDVVNSWL